MVNASRDMRWTLARPSISWPYQILQPQLGGAKMHRTLFEKASDSFLMQTRAILWRSEYPVGRDWPNSATRRFKVGHCEMTVVEILATDQTKEVAN